MQQIANARRDQLMRAYRPSGPYVGMLGVHNTHYPVEVDAYMPRYEDWLRDCINRLSASNAPPLAVGVDNRSNRNLADVQVVLHIGTTLEVYEDCLFGDVVGEDPPEVPKATLELTPSIAMRNSPIIRFPTSVQEPEFQVDVSERSTAIRYAPCTFRPRAQVDLPILRAITLDDDVDEPIDVEWSATATSHDGVAKGEFVLTPADNIRVPNYELVTKILGPADHDGYGDATE